MAGLVFIWVGVLAVLLSFRIGKWVPTLGAIARALLLVFFAASVVVHAVRNGVQPLSWRDFSPSYAGFIDLVPLLIFNYVGFELPSSAPEEMSDAKRDVPFAVLRFGFASFLLYGGPILGHSAGASQEADRQPEWIHRRGQVGVHRVRRVGHRGRTVTLAGWGQGLAAVCAARVYLGDGWRPGSGGRLRGRCRSGLVRPDLTSFGTPVRVNVLSGVIATVVMVLAFALTGGSNEEYFAAGLGLAISTTFVSYTFTFPSLAVLRRKFPQVERP